MDGTRGGLDESRFFVCEVVYLVHFRRIADVINSAVSLNPTRRCDASLQNDIFREASGHADADAFVVFTQERSPPAAIEA